MAGYSGTPLVRKLGLKAGHRVARVGAARSISLPGLAEDVTIVDSLRGTRPFDVILLLSDRAAEMQRRATPLVDRLPPAGMLWLGWPKKSSGVPTDLSDGRVREIGLGLGLVDTKTCAIDETWSGLRFVRRLADR